MEWTHIYVLQSDVSDVLHVELCLNGYFVLESVLDVPQHAGQERRFVSGQQYNFSKFVL